MTDWHRVRGFVCVAVLLCATACADRPVWSRPFSFDSAPDGLYVLASGRWLDTTDSSRFTLIGPLNTVEIECHVERRVCIEARADLDKRSAEFDFLFVHADEYAIVSTADSVVVARATIGVYDTELRFDLRSQTAQRFARWNESAPGDTAELRSATWVLK